MISDLNEIMQAVQTLQAGDSGKARSQLLKLWHEYSNRSSPRELCIISHFLADTEDEVEAELHWDLLALKAAMGSTDTEADSAIDLEVQRFIPSLHLNVGDAYRRLGQLKLAQNHAAKGLAAVRVLENNGYAAMILIGLNRLLRASKIDSDDGDAYQ